MPFCNTCRGSFPDQASLRQHLTTHSAAEIGVPLIYDPSKQASVRCPHCPTTFYNRDALEAHLLSLGPKTAAKYGVYPKQLQHRAMSGRQRENVRTTLKRGAPGTPIRQQPQPKEAASGLYEGFEHAVLDQNPINKASEWIGKLPEVDNWEDISVSNSSDGDIPPSPLTNSPLAKRNQSRTAKASRTNSSPAVIMPLHQHPAYQNFPNTYHPASPSIESVKAPHAKVVDSFKYLSNSWSIVYETPETTFVLTGLCHDAELLAKSRYIMAPYTPEGLNDLRRCSQCFRRQGELKHVPKCSYHPGNIFKTWSVEKNCLVSTYLCCRSQVGSAGCLSYETHSFEALYRISRDNAFYPTPYSPGKRTAVAIDCEMGQAPMGELELIQISCVDYFTGEVLINRLVAPLVHLISYNTKWSGVTAEMMAKAIEDGSALHGWPAARAELWKYISSETIIVGHSLHTDLRMLRICHSCIVDSEIAIPRIWGRKHGVKGLCEELLGKKVQTGSGTKGHDCVEDAFSARELVIWVTRHPEEVRVRRERSEAEEAKRREDAKRAKEAAENARRKVGITEQTLKEIQELI